MDGPAQFLTAVALLSAGVMFVAVTTDGQKAQALLVLSIPQLYVVQVAGFHLPLVLLLAVACLPVAVLRLVRLHVPGTVALAAYVLAQSAAILWSADPVLGVRSILFQVPFVVVLALTASALNGATPEDPRRWLRPYAVVAVGLAVMVICFRKLPQVEEDFLRSPVARVFVNPNTLSELFTINQNNVLDPNKAGGVFTNGNVAAAMLGISAVALAAYAETARRRRYLVAAALVWTGVIATGSGMGIILAVAAPVVHLALRPARPATSRVIAICALAAGLIAAQILGYVNLAPGKELSANSRLLIWQFAAGEFLDHPVLGHGFGGWQIVFPEFAARTTSLRTTFPPHNAVIYLWSQTGIFGLLAGACVVVSLLAAVIRARASTGAGSQADSSATLVGFGWILLHGQVESFGLLGDEHLQPLLAVLIVLGMAPVLRHPVKEEQSARDDPRAERHRLPQPTPASIRGVHRRPGAGARATAR